MVTNATACGGSAVVNSWPWISIDKSRTRSSRHARNGSPSGSEWESTTPVPLRGTKPLSVTRTGTVFSHELFANTRSAADDGSLLRRNPSPRATRTETVSTAGQPPAGRIRATGPPRKAEPCGRPSSRTSPPPPGRSWPRMTRCTSCPAGGEWPPPAPRRHSLQCGRGGGGGSSRHRRAVVTGVNTRSRNVTPCSWRTSRMLAAVKTSAKGSPALRAKRARTAFKLVMEPLSS